MRPIDYAETNHGQSFNENLNPRLFRVPTRSDLGRLGRAVRVLDRSALVRPIMDDNEAKIVFWHRELPPLEADLVAEHTVEANSCRVPWSPNGPDTPRPRAPASRASGPSRCYLMVLGGLMTILILTAFIGIPLLILGWWMRRRGVSNVQVVEAAYAEYVGQAQAA